MGVLIGLDIGTTALKAAVFDTAGGLLAVSTQEYTLITPQVNYVEESGEVYWKALKDAVTDLNRQYPLAGEEEAALAISAQGETLFFLDRDGKLLRNAIVWMEQPRAGGSAVSEGNVRRRDLFSGHRAGEL